MKKAEFKPYYYAKDGGEIFYVKDSEQTSPYHYVLAVIDAPYVSNSSNDVHDSKPFGEDAKNFLQSLIKSNDIYLEIIFGDYAYVWLNKPDDSSDVTIKNQMINALMISKGYSEYTPIVMPYNHIVNPVYEKIFLELQKKAQDKKLGIWSLPENSPEERAKAEARRSQEEREAAEETRRQEIEDAKARKKEQQEYLKKANSVVITPKGKKYHYEWCRTVRGSYKTLTIKQAKKRGYKPCGVCVPPDHEVTLENSNIYWGDNVYISDKVRLID